MSRIEVLQPKSAEVSRERMPLSFVHKAKNRFSRRELTSVAGHELNHALVAISLGIGKKPSSKCYFAILKSGVCQGINGHGEECPKGKLNENLESEQLTSKPLPISTVIFSAKLLSQITLI